MYCSNGSDAPKMTKDDIVYVTEQKRFDENEISEVTEKILNDSKCSKDSFNKHTSIKIKTTGQENVQNLVQTGNQNFHMQQETNSPTEIDKHKRDIYSGNWCISQTNLKSDFNKQKWTDKNSVSHMQKYFVPPTSNNISKKEMNFNKHMGYGRKRSKDVDNFRDQYVHKKTHADILNFVCNICKRNFNNLVCLRIHYQDVHNRFSCDKCVYQTQYKSDFNKHEMMHLDFFALECNKCRNQFEAQLICGAYCKYLDIKNQLRRIHSCDQCTYLTGQKQNLTTHRKTHIDISNFLCIICGGKFKNETYLESHYLNIHKQQYSYMLAYDVYINRIYSATKLTKHKKTRNHDGNNFKCKVCKISFQDHLFLEHLKIYHMRNINNIQCNDCLRVLWLDKKAKYSLRLCEICKQYYETEVSFKLHNEEKHPRVFCNICFKQFSTIVSLEKHTPTHDNKNLNICPICYKLHNTKKDLHSHMQKHKNKVYNRIVDNKTYSCDSNLPVEYLEI